MNANIKVYLLKNATDTAAEAPYTWRVIPNGVANLNDLVADMLGRLNSSDERVKMVVREALECAIRRVRGGETVDIGPIRLKPRIPGSMPYEDSPFDPARDEFIIDVYADAELADTFDGVVPSKVSADDFAGAIKVSNVMDVATERFGEIRGTETFEILGNGITLDGDGEGVRLLDRKTDAVLVTAEVDTVSKGQRAKCHLPATAGGIAKGACTLEMTTFGLVGETTPRVFRKPVTLTEAVPAPEPEFTSATSEGCREGYVAPNTRVTVTGVGLRVPTEDESLFIDMPEGKGHANFTDVSVSADGTALTGNVGDWPEGAESGDGYVVWTDAEGATIAVCDVEVGT